MPLRPQKSNPIAVAAVALLVLFTAGLTPAYGQSEPRRLGRNEIGVGTLEEEIKDHWERVENEFGLPDPVEIRRLAEPEGRARLGSRLREFYGAPSDILYYRFAPEGPDWPIKGVREAARVLKAQLDRVSSLLPDLQMEPVPLPRGLARLPLDRRLALMSWFLSRVRGRLN